MFAWVDQLLLLLWKNFTIQRRRPIAALFEIIMPILFMAILAAVRQATKDNDVLKPAVVYPAFNESTLISLHANTNCDNGWAVAYVSSNSNTTAIILSALAYLSTNMTIPMNATKVNSEDDLVSYLVNNDTIPSGCAAGIVLSEFDGNYLARLRLESTPGGYENDKNAEERSWYTDVSFPISNEFGPRDDGGNSDYGNLPNYAPSGFLAFQHAIQIAIANFVAADAVPLLQDLQLNRMPYPSYTDDGFINAIRFGLPLLLMLAFLFSALTIVRNVVHEKERRLKESMKMMGLSNWLHWTAWFIQAFVFLLIAIIGCTILFSAGDVLKESDPTLIFVFLLLFIVATIQLCFFISVFFTSAATGSAAGGIIWFVTYIPYFFISNRYPSMTVGAKTASCLISTTAMAIGSRLIAEFESRGDGVQWSTVSDAVSSDDAFTFGTVLGMLLFDAIYYGILTWYIDGIRPGKYGIPRPWYFPFQASYWCGHKAVNADDAYEMDERNRPDSTAFEADPHGLQAGISIRNLRKVFDKKVAVAGTSLNMFDGQITALLGHNGAGKTTTMSMLTGLYPPTSGTAIVNGHDICEDIHSVQKSLGICPQHDVLFDTLTVEEHLWFFCKLKGVSNDKIQAQVDDMISALELPDKRGAQSRTLSGGMKRKLSCAIALVGGSKVVILDEPTSGMDPAARRATWELLMRYKAGRTILLSTHFLDEADLLGDRIAIMSDGIVQCAGTSLFLKAKYGVGYNLVLVKSDRDAPIHALDDLVKQFVPDAKLVGNVGMEVSYLLPRDQTRAFPPLFTALESSKASVNIDSYGISVSTLEEVFLKVGEGSGHGKLKVDIQARIDARKPRGDTSTDHPADAVQIDVKGADAAILTKLDRQEYNTGWALKKQQLYAMFVKRLLHSKRNKSAIISQLLLPLIFTLIALVVARSNLAPSDAPARSATSLASEYGENTVMFTDQGNFSTSASAFTQTLGQSLEAMYAESGTDQSVLRIPNDGQWSDMGDYILWLTEDNGRFLTEFNKKRVIALSFVPEGVNSAAITAWFNGQAYHTPSEALASVANILLRAFAPAGTKISFENAPLPRSRLEEAKDQEDNLLGFFIAFDILFGMAFLASSFVLFLVVERSNKAKHIQFVSGVDIISYWTASYIWDFATFLIPTFGCMILFAIFSVDEYSSSRLGYIFLLFVLYGLAIIPLMYLASFLFDTPSTAYTRLTMFNIITGLAAMLAVSILTLIEPETGNTLKNAFLFLPNFCFGQGISDIYTNYRNLDVVSRLFSLCQAAGANTLDACCALEFNVPAEDVPFELLCNPDYLGVDKPGIGSYLLCLAGQAVIFFALVLMVEAGVFTRLWDRLGQSVEAKYRNSTTHAPPADEDADVAAERGRILGRARGTSGPTATSDVLVVNDLTKVYKLRGKGCCEPGMKVSVDHMFLGIPHGECFGLLGVNGAGKTTTFNMLTGDIPMTSGTATVDSYDIRQDMGHVRQRIGYCPQFDGLIELMTGREVLTMYARLRGVPEHKIPAIVSELIYALMLEKHADKYCGTYSGGNKRKLSTAVALVGDPLIVFLDEPTSGMDAGARRFLWDALMKVMEGGRSIVLTSHSMEECEALCTRLAIMVNGRFQCLGSVQHLKSRFGQGFGLMAKVDGEPADTTGLKQLVKTKFPNSKIKDEHRGMVHFELSGEYTWSQIFTEMEAARESIGIIDYSVGQTSLEQVFLDFAKHQHEDHRQGRH